MKTEFYFDQAREFLQLKNSGNSNSSTIDNKKIRTENSRNSKNSNSSTTGDKNITGENSKNSGNSNRREYETKNITFGDGWEDLPKTEEKELDPYPIKAVPDALQAVILENNAYSQTPIEMDATVCFCSVSAVAQGLIIVKRDEKLKSSCSIYALLIADSGERKTQIEKTFNVPIIAWEAEQAEKIKPDLEKYNASHAAWESKKKGIKSAIALASKRGEDTTQLEQSLLDIEKDKPQEPANKILIHGDSTTQRIAFSQGVIYAPAYQSISEGGIFFGGHSANSENLMGTLAYYNSRYSNEEYKVGRRGSESFTVKNAPLTMLIMVQDTVLKAFFKRDQDIFRGSGVFARNLMVKVKSTQGERLYKAPVKDQPEYTKYKARMKELLNIPLNLTDGGVKPPVIGLSKGAFKAWVSFYNETEVSLCKGGDNEDIKDIVSKVAENASRLAGIFHVYEVGDVGEISESNMKSAITIVSWHMRQAQEYLSNTVGLEDDHGAGSLEAWLIKYLTKHNTNHIGLTKLSQLCPNSLRKKHRRDKAITALVESRKVRIVTVKKTAFLQLHPDLLKKITDPSAIAIPAIPAIRAAKKQEKSREIAEIADTPPEKDGEILLREF